MAAKGRDLQISVTHAGAKVSLRMGKPVDAGFNFAPADAEALGVALLRAAALAREEAGTAELGERDLRFSVKAGDRGRVVLEFSEPILRWTLDAKTAAMIGDGVLRAARTAMGKGD